MHWSEYLSSLSAECHERLITDLTLGVGHLQLAARQHQGTAPRTARILADVAMAYVCLNGALERLEVPHEEPLAPFVPFGVLPADTLPRRWRVLLAYRAFAVGRLVAQLYLALEAGVRAREAARTNTPVTEVAAHLAASVTALEGVRQLVAAA